MPEVADLHFPRWYLQRAWSLDRAHGILPHGGSLDTLPMSVLQDFDVLDQRYAHFYQEALDERAEQQETSAPGANRTASRAPLGEDFDLEAMFGDLGAGTAPVAWG